MGIGDWSDEFRMCRLVEAMRVLPASALDCTPKPTLSKELVSF